VRSGRHLTRLRRSPELLGNQHSPRSRLADEPADRPTGRVLKRYTQVELLLALREREPARIGELATRLKLAPNTIRGLLQQLVETHGRGPNPTDRRVAAVTPTPAGLAKLDEWELAHHRRLGAALAELGKGDQAAVRSALPALARLVEKLGNPKRS
jgi:DNA-binding MarR family transcriptional regulator